VSFDLSYLSPLTGLSISAATLNMVQTTCTGNPLSATYGGAIQAWHVSYGPSLTAGDCSTPNLAGRQYTLSTSLATGARSVSVAGAVVDDFNNRVARGSRSQFLIRTATLAASGLTYDYCSFGTFNQGTSSNDPYLNVTYEYD